MCLSNASQKMSVAMDDRHYRLENVNVDKKYIVVRKIQKVVVISGSRGPQKTELQDLQLCVVM